MHHKSRFLVEAKEGVWVQCPIPAEELQSVIQDRTQIGVTFKADNVRQVFASVLLRHDPMYPIPEGGQTDAVLLAFPAEIKAVQRRSNFRVQILPNSGLTLDCWTIARHTALTERPLPSQRVKLEVCDISLGGAGVLLPVETGKPPAITSDDRLRIQVKLNDLELLVEGRVRTPDTAHNAAIRTGIRFHFLDDGVDERLKVSQLAKIIAQLEIRQVKAIRKQAEAAESESNFPAPAAALC
jgi:c-di-GMP-binding flagellar brake protein YcgR